MKKITIILLTLSFLLLCGCNAEFVSNPDSTEQPTQKTPDITETVDTEPGTTIDWELPIDVDDSVTEPQEPTTTPTVTEPGVSGNDEQPTTTPSANQDPTEPETTGAELTEPGSEETTTTMGNEQPTEPTEPESPVETTVPPTTVPAPTHNQSSSGPIELPLIPG